METVFFAVIGAFLLSFLVSALLFSKRGSAGFLREKMLESSIFVSVAALFSTICVLPFFWRLFDFVSGVNVWAFIVPAVGIVLVVLALLSDKKYLTPLAVLIAAVASVYVLKFRALPTDKTSLLQWGISALCLWGYAMGFRSLVGLGKLPQAETIVVSGGLVLLSLFAVLPLNVGIVSAALLGAGVMAYIFSDNCPVGGDASVVLGFLLGWLGIVASEEYLLSCFVIFSAYYIVEVSVCLIRKMSFLPKYKKMEYNSLTLQAFLDGLPFDVILKNVWMVSLVLIVFGLFQINATNVYSIPAIALLITFWQIYKLLLWKEKDKSWKDVGKEFAGETKDSVVKIFNNSKNKADKD